MLFNLSFFLFYILLIKVPWNVIIEHIKLQAIGKTLGTHQTQEPKKTVKKTAVTQVKPFTQTSSIRTLEKVVTKPEVIPQKPKPVPRVKPVKKDDGKVEIPSKIVKVRRSLDLEKSEDSSLYVSALDDIGDDSTKKSRKSNVEVSNFCYYISLPISRTFMWILSVQINI